MQTLDRWSLPASVWLLVCFALAYLPDVGHGFISDDFSWILHSTVRSSSDLWRPLVDTPMGFYRPLVSWSFAANRAIAGLSPFGYALVNLLLVCGIAASIVALCRALGFTRIEGLFAASVWTFNLHGVGMAVMWISGRTSLLATLFAVLAATASTRGRRFSAGGLTLAALLSKEEPVLLPLILGSWIAVDRWRDGAPAGRALAAAMHRAWPSGAALGVYLVLRANTAALTPSTAPTYYALSASREVIVPNVLEYADRSLTFGTAALLLGFLLLVRRKPSAAWFGEQERRVAIKGGVWLVLAHALTVLVPVRSDLYACLPAIGAALMAMAAGRSLWHQVPTSRRRWAPAVTLALPLLLVPVYWGRNVFARDDAELSTRVLARVFEALRDRGDLSRVEIHQHAGERPSIGAAFGGGLGPALELGTGRRFETEMQLTDPSEPWPAPRPHTLRVTVVGDEMLAVAPPH